MGVAVYRAVYSVKVLGACRGMRPNHKYTRPFFILVFSPIATSSPRNFGQKSQAGMQSFIKKRKDARQSARCNENIVKASSRTGYHPIQAEAEIRQRFACRAPTSAPAWSHLRRCQSAHGAPRRSFEARLRRRSDRAVCGAPLVLQHQLQRTTQVMRPWVLLHGQRVTWKRTTACRRRRRVSSGRRNCTIASRRLLTVSACRRQSRKLSAS